jgi:hypothetical protein
MPVYSFLSTASNHCLCNNPAFLHCRRIYDVETLVQAQAIRSIALEQNPIFAVKLHALLKVDIQRDSFSVVRRDQKLFAVKFIADNLRRSSQSILFQHLFRFSAVVVVKDLGINEGRGVGVTNAITLIILVQTWVDFTNIIRRDS